jgi:hypothetical protein
VIEGATSETFAPHVGDRFAVAPAEGDPFEAVLSSCDETPYGSPEQWQRDLDRVPFSLMFHAESDPGVQQQVCSLDHAELGTFELFLVPLGPDDQGWRYEAVIS